MPAAIVRVKKSMFCNRLNVNEGLTDLMSVVDVSSAFTNIPDRLSIIPAQYVALFSPCDESE